MEKFTDKINLILVDDELEFLDAASTTLSRRGFEVSRAPNGRTAIDLIQNHEFDVMVLDVKMPGIDGVEVFHQVTRLAPHLPVIMLTGHGTVKQAFETSRDGVFEYLTKPFDIDKFAQVARRAVTESRRKRMNAVQQQAVKKILEEKPD
jgi:DNA-binding NtrC family response regulator